MKAESEYTIEELKAPDCPNGCIRKMREARQAGELLHIICECDWMVFNPYKSFPLKHSKDRK